LRSSGFIGYLAAVVREWNTPY